MTKNRNFTQVYDRGFDSLSSIVQKNTAAARLYMFLAKHMDSSTGAVVADQQILADHLDYSVRSIQRAIKFLEDNHHLVRIPVGGNLSAFALDPRQVWKGSERNKDYAVFVTTVITQRSNLVTKKLQVMMEKKKDA